MTDDELKNALDALDDLLWSINGCPQNILFEPIYSVEETQIRDLANSLLETSEGRYHLTADIEYFTDLAGIDRERRRNS